MPFDQNSSGPVDHEKVVLGQMLGEAYQHTLGMRIQLSMLQAEIAQRDAQIASLKAQLAPPAEPASPDQTE